MTTRRAQKHKGLVNFEKQYHHRPGIHLNNHRKLRGVNLLQAVVTESAYEWRKREKRNPKLAQELNELFGGLMQK